MAKAKSKSAQKKSDGKSVKPNTFINDVKQLTRLSEKLSELRNDKDLTKLAAKGMNICRELKGILKIVIERMPEEKIVEEVVEDTEVLGPIDPME